MGYKELIETLRGKDGCNCECLQAADAIETILAERNAAVEDLRGMCWCCTHGEKWDKAPIWSRMTTCEYIREQGVLASSGGKRKCQHWEWRGPRGNETR